MMLLEQPPQPSVVTPSLRFDDHEVLGGDLGVPVVEEFPPGRRAIEVRLGSPAAAPPAHHIRCGPILSVDTTMIEQRVAEVGSRVDDTGTVTRDLPDLPIGLRPGLVVGDER